MNNRLILVPTPIADELPLEVVAKDLLLKHSLDPNFILLVEEHKEARRRWLRWGLPREAIEKFIIYNEHHQEDLIPSVINALKKGKAAFLLSDGGLPAVCDPGQKLIEQCHRHGISVTSTPFPNSIILALALSGFETNEFVFRGFLPQKKEERELRVASILEEKRVQVLMDTPYRLIKTLDEFKELSPQGSKREFSVALNLCETREKVIRGSIDIVRKSLDSTEKAEFILVLGPK